MPVSALEAFVTAAKQLPREGACDVVEDYVRISVECAEVFQLLGGERPPESQVGLSCACAAAVVSARGRRFDSEFQGATRLLPAPGWGTRAFSHRDLRKHFRGSTIGRRRGHRFFIQTCWGSGRWFWQSGHR